MNVGDPADRSRSWVARPTAAFGFLLDTCLYDGKMTPEPARGLAGFGRMF
jgi:hypothetical protein